MFHKEEGFTLIELLIVIVIIGVLAAIAVPAFSQRVEVSKATTCRANLSVLEGSMEGFRADSNANALPADMAALTGGGYLKRAVVCPKAGNYVVNEATPTCSIGANGGGALRHVIP